jgi:hypothetical protein
MKYGEIIADNLKKAGWSWGWLSGMDLKDAPPGLLTRIATESGSLCTRMKS